MPWNKLIIHSHAAAADTIADALTDLGALAVTLQNAGDEPLFQIELNSTPLWQHTQVHALFTDDSKIEPIVQTLATMLPTHAPFHYTSEYVADENWVEKTQANFPPIQIDDKLIVAPSWHRIENFSGSVVYIDPGLAFGTGTHPTTYLCLEWLAQHDIQNKVVIDYGCGSGILALAAKARGARSVFATDHDPQAITATLNNLAQNPLLQDGMTVLDNNEAAELNVAADIVIANILAQPLLQLQPRLIALCRPGGVLVLSGILAEEKQKIIDTYCTALAADQSIIIVAEREGWIRIEITR